MAAQQPGVTQIQNDRRLLAQPGQCPQVKIASMQIVTMNDVRRRLGQTQEIPGPRVPEILDAEETLEPPQRIRQPLRRTNEEP